MAKVMISIPDPILKKIDRLAKKESETRSRFIRERVLSSVERPSPKKPKSNAKIFFAALDKARDSAKWTFPDGVNYVRSIRGKWD